MDLKSELEKRREIFEKELQKYLQEQEPKMLYDAVRHLPLSGGKRLRPILSIIACEAVGGRVEDVIPFAVSLELIHSFTLVHDDIMDKSTLRRNIQTVHIKFGESTAIIAGDTLFAKAFEVLHNIKTKEAIEIAFKLSKCVKKICEGQQMDMEFEKRKIVSEEEYLKMIGKKTASLFKFSTEGGAVIGGGSNREIKALSSYGWNLGLAFQIRDDYLDIHGEENILGKDIGNDIRNGKKTILVVHAIKVAKGEDKKKLLSILGKRDATDKEIKEVFEILLRTGSIGYAESLAKGYYREACKSLEMLRDSPQKKLLKEIARYSIERKK